MAGILVKGKAAYYVIFFVLILTSQQGWCWGAQTHRVICDIAWRNLSAKAKPEVSKLLVKAKQKTFASSCVWADKIKSKSRYKFTKVHHYLNVPESATQIDMSRDCGHKGCVVEAVEAYANVLRGKETADYINDPAKALMFLGHFVGDLHQPLHVSYARDWGGNSIYLRGSFGKVALHYLWDVTIPESGLPNTWRQGGEKLSKRMNSDNVRSWQTGTAREWANESFTIVRQIYKELDSDRYADIGGVVDSEFLSQYYPVSETRIMQAGVRLAAILNEIYE